MSKDYQMSQRSPKKGSSSDTPVKYVYVDKVAETLARNQARIDALPPRDPNRRNHVINRWACPGAYELKRDACNAYPGLEKYYGYF